MKRGSRVKAKAKAGLWYLAGALWWRHRAKCKDGHDILGVDRALRVCVRVCARACVRAQSGDAAGA